jgi:hypothetical protein
MSIIWSFFKQKFSSWHFSYLCSTHILLKKIGEKN